MIRPEVKTLAWRWREVLFALALIGIGIWWGMAFFGIVAWIGWGLAVVAAGFAVSAAQKVRFRGTSDGPGVVVLDERRVTYLGPEDGGVADLDLMVQLDVTPAPAWRLINRDGHFIDIPTDAKGVEVLFDAFTALPGLNTEHMLSVLHRKKPAQMTVWMAPDHRPYRQLN
ncbi:hypothetical protein [Pseudooctadecabacter jejudonensis]|uniref:Uncharacterized protein n=1 Tax=Pseudooctadecabacter jejudonensis TaxID=1391910 RepID=A0A1Y5T4H8_9RHOB|nr:hypothetical protein [Pseudooctadecabacter jejudonensis]SLN53836.1 hypothetical protein PSJ8397_02806 [Pseudooctadecabacter jejudonensis]